MISLQEDSILAWHGGTEPASNEVILAAEVAESAGEGFQILYDHSKGEGDYSEIVNNLYRTLDAFRELPNKYRAWDTLDGYCTLILTLFDHAPSSIKDRVSILQRLGSFRFDRSDDSEQKKSKISEIFSDRYKSDNINEEFRKRAEQLYEIWSPNQGSLLSHMMDSPTDVAEALYLRLNRSNEQIFRIIGHPFKNVPSVELVALAKAQTVAYQRGTDIHLIMGVCPVLKRWDQDVWEGTIKQFTLLDVLLIHELVELWLSENEPDIVAGDAHVIATVFERYLKGPLLRLAVEDFFLDWPQPLGKEIVELQREEMAQQVSIWRNQDCDRIELVSDEDIDGLPFLENSSPKKLPQVVEFGEVSRKIYKNKEGKLYRLVDGKKVFVRKKG